MDGYLGVDVGSVTTKCAVITEAGELIASNYLCAQGKPVLAGWQGLREVKGQLPASVRICG
jgi:activator of 2-hydroxyglutaryl-CoA dehydratase